MRLSIKNLGPIDNGHIDLNKNLIILTGPNNSGKSYLTYLIHGISQFNVLLGVRETRNSILSIVKDKAPIKSFLQGDSEFDLVSFINDNISSLSDLVTSSTEKNFSKIFASSSVKAHLTIEFDRYGLPTNKKSITRLKVIDGNVRAITIGGDYHDDFKSKVWEGYNHSAEVLSERLIFLYTIFILNKEVDDRTYFFPAERTAINLFAKHITSTKAEIKDELDSDVIVGMSDEELGRRLRAQVKAAPKYPYAIRDYINFVNNFKPSEDESKFAFIANAIETALTGGSVHLDTFEQLIFTPKGSDSALELHLSSSLVKSLSYLILYLRYTAKEGDQIIIDEPELNLHPDLQIELAKVIAEMVNAGLKVIISTHSDYLIKELNNIILLGELNKKKVHKPFIQEKGFSRTQLLTKKQVGAYFLHSGIDGGTIEPINIEKDGLVVPTINDAIRRVDGLAEEVYMEMEG